MSTKEEIVKLQEFLSKLSHELVAALAIRSALRLLPLISRPGSRSKIPFSFFSSKIRSERLIAVFISANSLLHYIFTDRETRLDEIISLIGPIGLEIEGDDKASRGSLGAALACNSIALAAMTVTNLDAYAKTAAMLVSIPFDFPRNGKYSHITNQNNAHLQSEQVSSDLHFISNNDASVTEFMCRPLWTENKTRQLDQAIYRFLGELSAVGDGFEIWRDWYDRLLVGTPIDTDFISRVYAVPVEIKEQSAQAVNKYIVAVGNKLAIQPLNRVRAIFIGYGEAGKTSLVRVLHDEPVPEGKEPMTAGIDIREWLVPGTEIKAHFWDFGGQVMVHATHQLFLRASCLYVLVISARSEISASEQAEYWLEHVRAFGGNSQVMIVGNRIDQAALNIDMGMLSEKYPNIVGYYPLSCTQASGRFSSHVNNFKRDFCNYLKGLTTHQVMFTNAQFEVLKSLRKLTLEQSFLPKNEFEEICSSHGIDADSSADITWLLDILDKLGVIIHFPQLPFADGYVLNPRWLTYGVYTIMYARRARLHIDDVVRMLSKTKVEDEFGNELRYPPDKCRLIMDAMHEFKLCYPLKEDLKTIIIPALLPAEKKIFVFDKSSALSFEYAFEAFLPRHILPELIVNRHVEIVSGMVWQTGVHLESATVGGNALVTVDYHARRLFIWVAGVDAKDYLTILRDDLDLILRRISVDYRELIGLPSYALISKGLLPSKSGQKAVYRQVLAHAARGMGEFTSENGETYDVSLVLRNIVSAARQKSDTVQYNNFFGSIERIGNVMSNKNVVISGSTVNGSVAAADTISDSFNVGVSHEQLLDLRALFEKLKADVDILNAASSPGTQRDVKEIIADVEILSEEFALDVPDESRIRRRIDGILGAAKTVGQIGLSVLEGATAIKGLIG